jgi:hypothetical protein
MTCQTRINNATVTWNLTETEIGPNIKADLISRGFDGTAWEAESVPTAKQVKRVGMFHRSRSGKFVPFIVLRA